MTRPFLTFPFKSTGANATHPRSLPDRLRDWQNVKDFGATGDGVTDDWQAITNAFNAVAPSFARQRIFFPPGTYYVSQPIDYSGINIISNWEGVYGLSTIVGNFPDFVLRRTFNAGGGEANGVFVENLTVINNNATGGGIRLGHAHNDAIRNCVVTANRAISTENFDFVQDGQAYEMTIENCILSPGSNTTGSVGIEDVSDGTVRNCRMVGFDIGLVTWNQAGAQNILGCYFELCKVGLESGVRADGALNSDNNSVVSGCRFKNCGTAIYRSAAYARFSAITIEAATGTIAGNPQYGIHVPTTTSASFMGISVTGQYAVAGITMGDDIGNSRYIEYNTFVGVQSINTAGPNWQMPQLGLSGQFIGCNCAPVVTAANLPAYYSPLSSITWSSSTGLATFNLTIAPLFEGTPFVTISGVSPAGYNGVFAATPLSAVQGTYAIPNPGSPTGTGGFAVVNPMNGTAGAVGQKPNAQEGDCYNISDSDISTWGGSPTTGGGSTHAKVRWNGSNWTVIGK